MTAAVNEIRAVLTALRVDPPAGGPDKRAIRAEKLAATEDLLPRLMAGNLLAKELENEIGMVCLGMAYADEEAGSSEFENSIDNWVGVQIDGNTAKVVYNERARGKLNSTGKCGSST